MQPIHVDSSIKQDEIVEAREDAELLGVKLQTLYAYASRHLIQSVPGATGRARLYAKADLERSAFVFIGTAGFEPATPATPLQCATGLRHVPFRRRGIVVHRVGGR